MNAKAVEWWVDLEIGILQGLGFIRACTDLGPGLGFVIKGLKFRVERGLGFRVRHILPTLALGATLETPLSHKHQSLSPSP